MADVGSVGKVVSSSGTNESIARKSICAAVNRLRSSIGAAIQCAMPAIVESYDRKSHKAIVQPLVNIPYISGNKVEFKRREKIALPVWRFAVGGFMVDFPIRKGDTGWMVASDRDSGVAKDRNSSEDVNGNLGAQNPNRRSTHQFLYGFFIPDKWGDIAIPDEDGDSVVIQSLGLDSSKTSRITIDRNGSVCVKTGGSIKLDSASLEFNGPAEFFGPAKFSDKVSIGSDQSPQELVVYGKARAKAGLDVSSRLNVIDDLSVEGDCWLNTATFNGKLVASGGTFFYDLFVDGLATFGSGIISAYGIAAGFVKNSSVPSFKSGKYAAGACVSDKGLLWVAKHAVKSEDYDNPTYRPEDWVMAGFPQKEWKDGSPVATNIGECLWYSGDVYANIGGYTEDEPPEPEYYVKTDLANYITKDDAMKMLLSFGGIGVSGDSYVDGSLRIGPKGRTYDAYSSSAIYGAGAIVLYNNKYYVATRVATFSAYPPTNTTYWAPVPTSDSSIKEWKSGTSYSHNTFVKSNGQYFVYIYSSASSTHNLADTDYWQYVEIADILGVDEDIALFVNGKSYTHGVDAGKHQVAADRSPI